MPRHRHLRKRWAPEDAADGCELLVWEKDERPRWHCEECGTVNDGWRDLCAYCGRERDDGW